MTVLLKISEQHVNIGSQTFQFPDVEINSGELVGLIGQSGTGKSILLRQLAGLMDTGSPLKSFGKRKAFIFSRGGLFQHQSVRDNLKMPTLFTSMTVSDENIDRVMRDWKLSKIQHHFPTQLNPQAIRIAQIARAVLLKPDIVFIEKPLYGLSVQQSDQLIQWIQSHIETGKSVVYSEENRRIFHTLKPRLIELDGGHDNLRTVMQR